MLSKYHFIPVWPMVITLFAGVVFLPPLSARASSEGHQARQLMGKVIQASAPRPAQVEVLQKLTPSPEQIESTQEYDQSRNGTSTRLDSEASLFIDMQHESDPVTETWKGTAGLELNW